MYLKCTIHFLLRFCISPLNNPCANSPSLHYYYPLILSSIPTPASFPPLLPLEPSVCVSLPPPKWTGGSGDIGEWDGRMFKLELVFISCLISWRLSPRLSAANPVDLSEACRQAAAWLSHTHMNAHTHAQTHVNAHTRTHTHTRINT